MNAFAQAFYDSPLFTDTLINPGAMKSLLTTLEKEGLVEKFVEESGHDRYVFKDEK